MLVICSWSSNAAPIFLSGTSGFDGEWEISTVSGPANSLLSALQTQVWWEDDDLARIFVLALEDQLGSRGPLFAFTDQDIPVSGSPLAGFRWNVDRFGRAGFLRVTAGLDFQTTFAVAQRVSVSEPSATLLLSLCVLYLGFKRRRVRNSGLHSLGSLKPIIYLMLKQKPF